MSQLNLEHPIELTHTGEIISEDGRKWKAGKYAAGVVPAKFAVRHLGKNLDPNIKHEYAKPPVLGEEDKPELKLETDRVQADPLATKVEDKPAAVKAAATPTIVPASA